MKTGEAQSEVAPAAPDNGNENHHSPLPSTKQASSLESLLQEAAAYGNDENESIEAKAEKALECPCIADLRNGLCGDQFSEAFLCYLKSTAEEKGSDCVLPFVALQNCIKSNPNAFSKEITGGGGGENGEAAQEYKIIPPLWSREPRSRKPKLLQTK